MGAHRAIQKGGGALPLVVLAAALLGSLFWFVHPFYDPVKDGSLYVLTARSLATGEGYSLYGVPFIVRPPGFSALLVPILASCGTSFLALNLFVSLWGVLALALLFALIRTRIGTGSALALCGLIWVSPGWQRLCNQVLSDVPGMALILACLLVDRAARERPSVGRDALLGALIGVSAYVRTLALLAVPAILLARWLSAERDPRTPLAGKLLVAVLPALLLAPWVLRNRAVEVPVPPEEVHLYSYGTAMWRERPWDPASPRLGVAEIAARVPERAPEWSGALGGLMGPGADTARSRWVGALLILGWLVALARRRRAEDLFAGAVLMVLSVYFAFRPRLVLPALLFVLPAAVETLQWLLGRALGERRARAGTTVALAALGAVVFHPLGNFPEIEQGHRGYLALAQAVEERFPPGVPLGAPLGWHYAIYLEGRRVHSAEVLAKRRGWRAGLARLREHGVEGLLADEAAADGRFGERVSGSFREVDRAGGHVVFVKRPGPSH